VKGVEHTNVYTANVPYGSLWYLLYITSKDVQVHEQLFVSYGNAYWTSRKRNVK
jgi:hypothetical protein